VLKVTKLRKIALLPLRKKIRSSSSSSSGGSLSGIRAITAARCLLLLPRLLGVGRLAAATVYQLIMGLLSWSFARRTGSAADLYRLRDACPG